LLTRLGLLLYLRSLAAPGLVTGLATAAPAVVTWLSTTFARLTLAATSGLTLTSASSPTLTAASGPTLTAASGLTLTATAGLALTAASGLALTATAVATAAVPTSRLATRPALPLSGVRRIHECCRHEGDYCCDGEGFGAHTFWLSNTAASLDSGDLTRNTMTLPPWPPAVLPTSQRCRTI
jgi:hypothetical protein